MSEAVYVVEYRSISHGIGVLDRMLKMSSLLVLYANPICIGKYLICVGGDVADVREACRVAESPEEQEGMIAGRLLTSTHPEIMAYFRRGVSRGAGVYDAIGVLETRAAAPGFVSLDKALKSARVEVLRVWQGQFLGGKFCYVLGGSTSDIQSAVNAAKAATPEKEWVGSRVIPSPDAVTLKMFTTLGKEDAHGPSGTDF